MAAGAPDRNRNSGRVQCMGPDCCPMCTLMLVMHVISNRPLCLPVDGAGGPETSLLDPCLIRSRGPSGQVVVRLGVLLVDDNLEFLKGRCRPSTVVASAYDLRVFFGVVDKARAVRPADVLGSSPLSARTAATVLGRNQSTTCGRGNDHQGGTPAVDRRLLLRHPPGPRRHRREGCRKAGHPRTRGRPAFGHVS